MVLSDGESTSQQDRLPQEPIQRPGARDRETSLSIALSGCPTEVESTQGSRCRSKVFCTFQEAQDIREPWTNLGVEVGADLFGSFEWCELWWSHFSQGRTLEIHTQWVNDELVGLWPLFREELRLGPLRLTVIRLLGGDHAGTRCFPLVNESHVNVVISTLLGQLDTGGHWDVFHIGDLPGYYPQVGALLEALNNSRVGAVLGSLNYYPHAVFDLGESFDQYIEKLSSNERNNIRKCDRRLAKAYTLRHRLVFHDEVDRFLANFYKWHDEYWLSQHELGFFTLWPGSRDFHADVARLPAGENRPILLEVHANDRPIGLVFAHRHNNRLHLFQVVRAPDPSFESYSPGRILHCETFRSCLAEGIRCVDAMSGFYEYKRRLGADFLGLTSIAMVRHNRRSRARAWVFRWAFRIVDAVYFRLWLCRVAPILRKRFHRMNCKFLYAGMSERFIRWRFLGAALAGPLGPQKFSGAPENE